MVQNFSINLKFVYLNQGSEPVQGTIFFFHIF